MDIKKIFTNNWTLVLYFVLSIIAILPFLHNGFFQIHDDVQVARVYEMGKSLSSGNLPVRWVEDLGYGFGYPIFNFYSVLPYYIAGIVSVSGLGALFATKLIFILTIIGSGVCMYYLVKEYFGKIPALVSALVYLYFPYHAVNIYVRGDLAELSAYAFLPLVFLSFFKIHSLDEKRVNIKYLVLGSLSVAAVILSHNLSAFMLFIFLGIFIVYSLAVNKNKKNVFISYASVLILAFSLSAFYAVPATLEASYTNVLTQVGGGADYKDNYICLNQLWDSPWGFGGSVKGCVDGLSFKLGKTNIVFAILGLVGIFLTFKRLKDKKFIAVFSFIFLALSLFMSLEYSSFIWNLPFMDFLQYPWRFLNFTGLFLSLLVGILIWSVKELFDKKIEIFAIIVIVVLTLVFNAKLFMPQRFLDRNESYYTNKYYLNWTASGISDEYLPKNFIRPNSYEMISIYNLDYNNNLYKTIEKNGRKSFSFSQTTIQKASNLLTIVGVLALIAVIIFRSRFYGKKTS